eukprot:COSAG02_NODE_4385_length_5421_cov_4.928035_9_plen_99_part_00
MDQRAFNKKLVVITVNYIMNKSNEFLVYKCSSMSTSTSLLSGRTVLQYMRPRNLSVPGNCMDGLAPAEITQCKNQTSARCRHEAVAAHCGSARWQCVY